MFLGSLIRKKFEYYFNAFLYLHYEYNYIRFIVSDGNAISKTKEFTTSYKELLQWLCGKTEFYNNELWSFAIIWVPDRAPIATQTLLIVYTFGSEFSNK